MKIFNHPRRVELRTTVLVCRFLWTFPFSSKRLHHFWWTGGESVPVQLPSIQLSLDIEWNSDPTVVYILGNSVYILPVVHQGKRRLELLKTKESHSEVQKARRLGTMKGNSQHWKNKWILPLCTSHNYRFWVMYGTVQGCIAEVYSPWLL